MSVQILWWDPRLSTSPRPHPNKNCIVCTQTIKPGQQKKNPFSPRRLKTKTTASDPATRALYRLYMQLWFASHQDWSVNLKGEFSCAFNTPYTLQNSQKKASYAYFWTRHQFIFTLDQQGGIFSTGFSVTNEACTFPKVNSFALGGAEISGFLPEGALIPQGVYTHS